MYGKTESTKGSWLIVAAVLLTLSLISGFANVFIFAKPGAQGLQGEQGLNGNQGIQGYNGSQGPQGEIGPQGLQGEQGLNGNQGIQGIQGEQGPQGIQGERGPQGIQGEPGLNGTDAIQQVLQSLNLTAASVGGYSTLRWLNMSVLDSSMRLIVTVNDQSRMLVEFVTSVRAVNSGVWFRVVVDNQYVSAVSYTGLLGSSSLNDYDSVQVKFLTFALSAGKHTIDVQFYLVSGNPMVLDRSLFVTELPSS
jgi:hypothetical protein